MTAKKSILSKARAVWLTRFPKARPLIIKVTPHDNLAFTQGLAFSDGVLFESTGLQDASSIRRLDAESSEPRVIKALPDHWGEGIACRGKEITQLTWKSGLAFVYTCPHLEPVRTLRYEGEGWGLAAYKDGFVMTDGSEWLTFRDSEFHISNRVQVKIRGTRLRWLNDLEYANGFIYANRLGDNCIYKIDPCSGKTLCIVDCSALVEMALPNDPGKVLNGIAFSKESQLFALTGKMWSKMFFVKFN